jgi:protease-4
LGLSLLVITLISAAAFLLVAPRSEGSFSLMPAFDRLGVVSITGPIMDSTDIINALAELEEDYQVKAVVVRIDSPGGAVGASQEIYHAIRDMKKPVVASLGNTAASGGYYIAAACDVIVGNPGTITGSIGVISVFPNLEELFATLGIKFQTLSSGPLKGAGHSDRPLNPAEHAMFEVLISDIHRQFVEDVASARSMDKSRVLALADGRIFTGRQALENNLIDELGNYHDALRAAALKAGLPKVPELFFPQDRGGLWERFASQSAHAIWRQCVNLIFTHSLPNLILPLPSVR